jgi:hypothetical protein
VDEILQQATSAAAQCGQCPHHACCALLSGRLLTPAAAARHLLSGLFTADAAVRQLVGGAVLPATVMLSLAWNNALEGCLLGEAQTAAHCLHV